MYALGTGPTEAHNLNPDKAYQTHTKLRVVFIGTVVGVFAEAVYNSRGLSRLEHMFVVSISLPSCDITHPSSLKGASSSIRLFLLVSFFPFSLWERIARPSAMNPWETGWR